MSTATDLPPTSKSWPDYRAVWRWHFYASLFSIPFVIILSITGGIYLFKPQIEAYSERPFENLAIIGGTTKPVAEQIQAALAAVPNSTLKEYEVPRTTTSAARVIVRDEQGAAIRAYVHPVTLEVLHTFPDSDRFSRIIFRIHGELLMGDRGSMIVELAASWTIIMILTGLYLWWPRNSTSWGGILYPRLMSGKKIFWRDLHSVTGIWLSGFTLFFLISGLPWAKSWGNYLKAVRSLTNTAVAQQEWSNTSEPAAKKKSSAGEHSGHGDHGGGPRRNRVPAKKLTAEELAAVDLLVTTVYPLGLAHPVVIAPPSGDSQNWSVKSMTANRPYRENLTVNGETGAIVSREGFREKHWIDKAVSVGIAAHEGALFGWPNQILGLMTVLGLLLICFSGLVLWWRRRDSGTLGAPKANLSPRVSFGLVLIIVALGLYLPLFGTSLLMVLFCEWTVLRQIPPVRDWLGLQRPAPLVATSAVCLVAVCLLGCGGPQPITGGTPGVLRAGELQLAEMQVTVYEMQSGFPQAIGFAVTGADGSFQLVTNEARSALHLQPGSYRCTLASAGSPVRIPPVLTKPETTPLQVTWAASDTRLNLEVPFRLSP